MSTAFEDALVTIWLRTRPALRARVDVIEAAVAARAAGTATADGDEAARSEAHKLAGVLGTFGHPDGTSLARTLESRFAVEGGDAQELAGLVAGLREVIER